jgi:hypothetical protein
MLIAALALGAGALWAQYQVNPQASMQVNRGLAGTPMTGSVRYAQTSMPMNSEVRYAAVRSGALPSDIRAGYGAMGPLSPGGAMDYIPPAPSWTASKSAPPPAAQGGAAYSVGSVRYAPTSAPMQPLPVAVSPSLVQPSNLAIPKPAPLPAPTPSPKPLPLPGPPTFSSSSSSATSAPQPTGSVRYAP